MGVCPAFPDGGKECWAVAGTFCGGKVQGTSADKRGGCLMCEFYKRAHASSDRNARRARKPLSPQEILPLGEAEELAKF